MKWIEVILKKIIISNFEIGFVRTKYYIPNAQDDKDKILKFHQHNPQTN